LRDVFLVARQKRESVHRRGEQRTARRVVKIVGLLVRIILEQTVALLSRVQAISHVRKTKQVLQTSTYEMWVHRIVDLRHPGAKILNLSLEISRIRGLAQCSENPQDARRCPSISCVTSAYLANKLKYHCKHLLTSGHSHSHSSPRQRDATIYLPTCRRGNCDTI